MGQHLFNRDKEKRRQHNDAHEVLTVIYEIAILLQITEQFFIGCYLITDAQLQEI